MIDLARVGRARTGVKQGDPAITILFAVAVQEAIIRIYNDVWAITPCGLADNIDLHGD